MMDLKRLTEWTRFNTYLYKHWRLQVVVIVLGLVTVPLTLITPYLAKLGIDEAYANRDLELFFKLAAAGGAAFVVNGLISTLKRYLSRRINRRIHFNIASDLFRHLQYLPLRFFRDRSTGEHIYRISADVRAVSDFLTSTIPQFVTLLPKLVVILFIVFRLNPQLALLAALLVPVSFINPYVFARRLRGIARETASMNQGVFKSLQEVFSHILLVKALGKEETEIRKFEGRLAKVLEFELRRARVTGISSFSSSLVSKVLAGVVALYGGYQVIQGTMMLGTLTATMIYLTQLMGLVASFGSMYQTITVNSVRRQRLAEILDIPSSVRDPRRAVPRIIEKGGIEFRNVVFGYTADSPVLRGLSFSIRPGAKVALVGSSGCGKTTIICLILQLYEPQRGTILLDGIDARTIALDSLKSQVDVALQEPLLWNDTIADNIRYGAESPSHGDMLRAARLARVDEFVKKLGDGYDSVMGERACRLSEGQKQRIAIARSLIRRPKILLLDEAMSSVDSETEDVIMKNIASGFADTTVLVVSHRLSTVRMMDQVCFLQDGATMETGTHEELLGTNHLYRELFASQVEGPVDETIVT